MTATGEFPSQRASDTENFPFDDVIMFIDNNLIWFDLVNITRVWSHNIFYHLLTFTWQGNMLSQYVF